MMGTAFPLQQMAPTLLLVGGTTALFLPSIVTLVAHAMSVTGDPQSLFVLLSGAAMLAIDWPLPRHRSERLTLIETGSLALCLILYVVGRALDILSLEIGAAVLIFYGLFAWLNGWPALRQKWAPLAFLAFIIPVPNALLSLLTSPLKLWISSLAASLLHAFDYPIARDGVTLYIAQYQLLVEDACAGLNTLVSLVALCLCYIFVAHPRLPRSVWPLILLVIPCALLANFMRVVLLVLVTYYAGNELAQGYFHPLAGLIMFIIALSVLIAVDTLLLHPQARHAR